MISTGFSHISYFCAMFEPFPCSLIAISSACGPHLSLHGSSLECFDVFSSTCLPRARSEIHSLLFALLSPLFLPRFLDIYPLRSDFPFSLCSIIFSVWFLFLWPFVYLRLCPPPLSSLSFLFSLFIPFACFF